MSDTGDHVISKTASKQDTVIVEVGDEIFSVKEMGDETRIKIGKKEFRVVENNDGVVVFKSSSEESHKKDMKDSRVILADLN